MKIDCIKKKLMLDQWEQCMLIAWGVDDNLFSLAKRLKVGTKKARQLAMSKLIHDHPSVFQYNEEQLNYARYNEQLGEFFADIIMSFDTKINNLPFIERFKFLFEPKSYSSWVYANLRRAYDAYRRQNDRNDKKIIFYHSQCMFSILFLLEGNNDVRLVEIS